MPIDAILTGNSDARLSSRAARSDGNDLLFREFGQAMTGPTGTTTLRYCIGSVFLAGPKKQVLRVHSGRVIAAMADLYAFGDDALI